MSAELRLLDDDFDIEKCAIEECEKALESLTKEMIKRRIVTMPKIYVVSSGEISKESLFQGFTKMQPLLTKHEDCVIVYLSTYYKPMKKRKRRNRAWQNEAENL